MVLDVMKKIMKLYRCFCHCLFGLGCVLLTIPAWADIPPAPSGGGSSSSDEIQQGMTVFVEGAKNGDLVMYVIALFVYVGLLVAAFIYAKKNKEWGQFGIVGLAGAVVIVIVLVVLNQIKTAVATMPS